MKKRARRDNQRRKKTIAQRKAQRKAADDQYIAASAAWSGEMKRKKDERAFLLDVLQPIEPAIAQAITPHLPNLLSNPTDDLYDEMVAYAFDLIFNNEDEEDAVAAVICDVYRDGPEAALPHLERAIQWNVAFNA